MHEFDVVANLIYLIMFSAGPITNILQIKRVVALFADANDGEIPQSCGIVMSGSKIYITIEDFFLYPNPWIIYRDQTVTYYPATTHSEQNLVVIPVSNFTYKIFLINNLQMEKSQFVCVCVCVSRYCYVYMFESD